MLKVSVVVPTLNRADLVANTIDRIERQTLDPRSFEVVVIDNGSTDRTLEVLAQKSATYSNLRVYSQPKRGAAATRNVGIRKASGEVILFVDDDIIAEPNLIESHLQYHDQHPNSSVVGTVVTSWADTTDPFLRYLRDRNIFNPYSIACGPMDFSYYHTGNVSTNRKLLVDSGGFNEDFFIYGMEDIELGYRLERMGCRMVPGTAARGLHYYYPTYQQFLLRCEQAGFSLGKMLDLHPELRLRFVENGKRTHWLKRFHVLYPFLFAAARPFSSLLAEWERRKGTGSVTPLLDLHYYWSIRYHFFVGYTQYVEHARSGQDTDAVLRLSGQRIPKFAMERRSKGI